jgi:DNA integrity scanning protein DisA with diadenylate cyclase activity
MLKTMKETKSSKVLSEYAKAQGFRVTTGVAEIQRLLLRNMVADYP